MLRSPWQSVRSVVRRYGTASSKLGISGGFMECASPAEKAGMRLVVLKLLSNHFPPSKRQRL